MASSDDEAEVHPQSVSDYHFEDDEKEPMSFSVLPIQWSESNDIDGESGQVFLDGFTDNGLQKVFMQVLAWKFDISGEKPKISVLSKKGRQWVKLEKPKKWFADTVRTILITTHFLHYVQRNPETSAKSVLGYLYKCLSYYEVRPSQNDLLDHLPLIREAAKRNAILAKSKLLLMLIEKPGKVKMLDKEVNKLANPDFIVDDGVIDEADDVSIEADDIIDEADDDSDKEDQLFDSVCVLCDNGGDLLCCDGICMRSFHATEEDGSSDEVGCDTLGYTKEEVHGMNSYICPNCDYKQHQCFVCGKLGSSDKSSGAEVFKCDVATCGHFYHLHCVAKELGKNIADGESFICPIHTCCICKERENKNEHELQFAVCRRCPTAYHRKCLPREIAFEDNEEGFPQRAWPDLLPNKRILIYCLKHELDEELGTPTRDHIRFPKSKPAVQRIGSSFEEETKPSTHDRALSNKNNGVSKLTENSSFKKSSLKKEFEHIISGSNVSRKQKSNDVVGRNLNEKKKPILKKRKILYGKESQVLLGKRPCDASMTKSSKKIEFGEHEANEANKSLSLKHANKDLNSTLHQLDSNTESRLSDLFKEATSSISMDDVLKKLKLASTYPSSLRLYVEKNITAGKLEGSVDAVRTALRRLDEGKSIQDATSVCDIDILKQIFKWRDKLRVYLAPVLNGNRYTSFGRHFTSVEKLEGIVDKLHWYIRNGDTIVDFCCGANDFSILMKKKLEETGKKCFYKNYDLLPTKNDFHFEVRDWMSVKRKELPKGSNLIMGLNPPFGVNGRDADMFINKALQFQPKLIILIVPPETERLDNKRTPYDLVWEEDSFLSGKSFYLPGSLDVNGRQIDQWNVTPPVLYLWSRQDWTDRHKAIAQEHDHLACQRDDPLIEKKFDEMSPADHIMGVDHDDDIMLGHDLPKVDNDAEGGWASRNEGLEENLPLGNFSYGNHVVQEHSISKSDKSVSNSNMTSQKKQTEADASRGCDVVSPPNKQAVTDIYDEVVQQSQQSAVTDRPAEEGNNLSVLVSPHEVNDHAKENDEFTSHTHKTRERGSPHEVNAHANDKYGSTFRSNKGRERASHVTRNQNQNRPNYARSHSDYRARNFEERRNSPLVGSPHSDYRARNFAERRNSPLIGSPRSFEYRSHFRDEQHLRETEIRQQIHAYGLQDQDYISSSYQSGGDSTFDSMGTNYGRLGSDPRFSYLNPSSTMQRYAPRLDESNHVRTRSLVSEPSIIGRNLDLHVPPQVGYRGPPPQPGYGVPPPRPGYGGGGPPALPRYGGAAMGFMHHHHAYSSYNSGGWLND